jgi:hypothetical protein
VCLLPGGVLTIGSAFPLQTAAELLRDRIVHTTPLRLMLQRRPWFAKSV